MKKVQYAVYRGEEFLDIGFADELAKKFNTTVKMIYWYACCKRFRKSKRHTKSIEVYKIEEGEDD